MEYVSIPVIVVMSYLVGEIFKKVIFRKKKRYKYIPVVVGVFGGVLGLVIYKISPEILFNINNPFEAVMVGIISGLASTGSNEIIKQIKEGEE